ncbi:Uncharacterised protein [Yersinia frederiksenii]|nr:Uncharacterised protein [Yersinia frederiksenii]
MANKWVRRATGLPQWCLAPQFCRFNTIIGVRTYDYRIIKPIKSGETLSVNILKIPYNLLHLILGGSVYEFYCWKFFFYCKY